MQAKHARRVLLAAAGGGALAVLAVSWLVGRSLGLPARRLVGAAPQGLGAVNVDLPSAGGGRIAGWYVPAERARASVLLLHGVGADRRQMLGRVGFLHARGYATLLIDEPSHGESSGEQITFGAREAQGVEAAYAYLDRLAPGRPIGVIGVSMGAAAAVLARYPRPPAAMVLESMYPTIEEATTNRLVNRFGAFGPVLAPLLLVQLPMRAGVWPSDLHPIEAVTRLASPVLIAAGSADRNTTEAETQRIYAAAHDPKVLWIVNGAGHVDLHAYAPADYEARVGAFLDRYLAPPP
jgi:uncharacterized protein